MDWVCSMFDHWYALDIGGHNINVMDLDSGDSVEIRSVIAWKNNQVQALGSDAFVYIYQDQRVVSVKYPVVQDQILSSITPLLQTLKKEIEMDKSFFRPRAKVLVPTEMKRR